MAIVAVHKTLAEWEFVNIYVGTLGNWNINNSAIPTIDLYEDPATLDWYVRGWAQGSIGTHLITVREALFPNNGLDLTIDITDGNGIYSCECANYPIYIEWLNIAGGRSSATFNLKSVRSVTSGDSKLWTDSAGIERKYSVDGKRWRLTVTVDMALKEVLQLVRSLNTSIQAWTHIGNGYMAEIIVDSGEMVFLNEVEKQGYTLSFEIAKNIIVQAQ